MPYVGLRWRRATSQAAIAALVVGTAIGGAAGLLHQTVSAEDRLSAPWDVGAIGSYLAVVVSLLTPQEGEVLGHVATAGSGGQAQEPADRVSVAGSTR